jgi:hypothetical protein
VGEVANMIMRVRETNLYNYIIDVSTMQIYLRLLIVNL